MRRTILELSLLTLTAFGAATSLPGQALASEESFLPTWKLMSRQEKQHFVSGYIQGWQDAERVAEVAKEFVDGNPKLAAQSLDQLKTIYNMRSVRPAEVAREIDSFYSDPDNSAAPLSRAMSSAREKLR